MQWEGMLCYGLLADTFIKWALGITNWYLKFHWNKCNSLSSSFFPSTLYWYIDSSLLQSLHPLSGGGRDTGKVTALFLQCFFHKECIFWWIYFLYFPLLTAQTWAVPVTHWHGNSWQMSTDCAVPWSRGQRPGKMKKKKKLIWQHWDNTWFKAVGLFCLPHWTQLLIRY